MVTVTNIERDVSGSRVVVYADLASVANNNTWIVPHLRSIDHVNITCTTDDSISCSTSAKTITFKDGATLAASIMVIGK